MNRNTVFGGHSALRKGSDQTGIVLLALTVYFLIASGMYHLFSGIHARYLPWHIFFPFNFDYPIQYKLIAGLSFLLPLVPLLLYTARRPKSSLYGDARFASRSEISKAGLFASAGIVLGCYGGLGQRFARLLMNRKLESVLAIKPTGSGKTSGMILPTLFHYPGSIIISDLDGSLLSKTGGFRSRFSRVRVFRVDGRPTHRINLLDSVRRGNYLRRDALSLSNVFIPKSDDEGGKGDYFRDNARSLLVAYIDLLDAIHHESVSRSDCYYTPIPRTLGSLWYLQNPKAVFLDPNGAVIDTPPPGFDVQRHFLAALVRSVRSLDDRTARYLHRFSALHEKQRQGVNETLSTVTDYFIEPFVDAATNASDINLAAIRRNPTSLYLQFSDEEYRVYAPLVKALFEVVFNNLTRALPSDDERHTVLFALDELANLGRINNFAQKMTLIRKYGGHVLGMIQNISQLDLVYTKSGAEVLLSCFKQQVFAVCNDERTARYISGRGFTRTSESSSESKTAFGSDCDRRLSTGQAREELIKGYEAFVIPKNRVLIFSESLFPFYAKLIQSWKWPFYRRLEAQSMRRSITPPRGRATDPNTYDPLTLYVQMNGKGVVSNVFLAKEGADDRSKE